jgi:hypothetical protein
VLSDVVFDLIQRGNPRQCLLDSLRLVRMRLEEFVAAMNPASSMGDADLLGITVTGRIPISLQDRIGIVFRT